MCGCRGRFHSSPIYGTQSPYSLRHASPVGNASSQPPANQSSTSACRGPGRTGTRGFTDCGLLYYRSDLLEKSGFSEPPGTWDELKEMAAKVQRDAGTRNGFVFTGAQYEGGTVLGLEFIRTAGGDVLDGDRVIIDSPEAIAGLTIQQSLMADGIAPKAVANFQEDEASGAFLRGDSVFMRMWPYAYDFLGDEEQSSVTAGQVGLAEVPVAAPDLPRPTSAAASTSSSTPRRATRKPHGS